jgi:hypothetical protein
MSDSKTGTGIRSALDGPSEESPHPGCRRELAGAWTAPAGRALAVNWVPSRPGPRAMAAGTVASREDGSMPG